MDETKKKNKMSGMIYGFFPIESMKSLERIDYNVRNTANFEIRLVNFKFSFKYLVSWLTLRAYFKGHKGLF